ncbi:MAG: aminoacetone oxidase family FAD-binding enzyme [candidate division Zixibacteria bacterium]|nr:aminoacetone oxidase family FAD-binding enzyme [candidate division Zixibacteria bacterium]
MKIQFIYVIEEYRGGVPGDKGMPVRNSKSVNLSPIIVIGGGPSGLLAAITASKNARQVILYNKNPWPGKKIAAVPSEELYFSEKLPPTKLASGFDDKSKFVAPIFKAFGYTDLIKLGKKMKLHLEADQFGHFKANGIPGDGLIKSLLAEAEKRGVLYKKSSRVSDIYTYRKKVVGVAVNSTRVPASAVILAAGSISAPKLGSTNDGYIIAEKLGHKINTIKPALTDLITHEKHNKILKGLTFDDVVISIYIDGRQTHSEKGEIKFKADSISGSFILNHSAEIIELLPKHTVEIRLDFMPEQTRESLETWLIKQLMAKRTINIKQCLNGHFSDGIIKAIFAESGIKPDKSVIHISNLERKAMVQAVKSFRMTIKAPKPFNYSRGVLGGVSTDEIDPHTCQSKVIKSLYFAGGVMDVLGPWGGYNMQFAFSSGYVAGNAACNGLK